MRAREYVKVAACVDAASPVQGSWQCARARHSRWRDSPGVDSSVSPASVPSVQPCARWGHVRVMDYQCIVVYTVINIAPPRVTAQAADLSDGCITWFKNKIKRSVYEILHLSASTVVIQASKFKRILKFLFIFTYKFNTWELSFVRSKRTLLFRLCFLLSLVCTTWIKNCVEKYYNFMNTYTLYFRIRIFKSTLSYNSLDSGPILLQATWSWI